MKPRRLQEVAIAHAGAAAYPAVRPFHPAENYPEYPFRNTSQTPNAAYDAVREALHLLGLDETNYGTSRWNPLGEMVAPGNRVVIKPNMVRHIHERGGDLDAILTHGAVVRAILDYVFIALQGRGEIVVADAPQADAVFESVVAHTGVGDVCRWYNDVAGFPVRLRDLRVEQAIMERGLIVERRRLAGDPMGYRVVTLDGDSAFAPLADACRGLRGSDYDIEETIRHHAGRHEYLISGTVLDADVFINVPKMKTHCKTGVTLCMKNLIGINGDKNWIPHYRLGGPKRGGDEFPDDSWLRHFESQAKDRFRQAVFSMSPAKRFLATRLRGAQRSFLKMTGLAAIRAGGWHGNDTIWRSILDLNRICLYADRDGRMQDTPARGYFAVIDGIIAGEGAGPFANDPVPLGAIIAGWNPVAPDIAALDLMGFDFTRIPKLTHALEAHRWPIARCDPSALAYRSNNEAWGAALRAGRTTVRQFVPPLGWRKNLA